MFFAALFCLPECNVRFACYTAASQLTCARSQE